MTYAEWQALAARTDAAVKRIEAMKDKEIRQTATAAGISADIWPIHSHNAAVSAHYGHPWPEVNYKLLRRVLWLESHLFDASRLRERILARAWNQIEGFPHAEVQP